jgi:spermidine synthase
MKAFGSQLIAEFLDCQEFQLLTQTDSIVSLLKAGIIQAGMDLREIAAHQFEPMGVTAVAIIGESHVALHTYPETCHLAVDIFTCAPGSEKPEWLLNYLQEHLKPQQVRKAEIIRGQKIVLADKDLLTDFSKSAYDIRYHVSAQIMHERSQWQEIQIIENPTFGRMLFLDQELQIAESDAIYHQTLVQPLKGLAEKSTVAILGGGDGGALNTLLQAKPQLKKIWLLERDPAVITASQRFLTQICGQAFQSPQFSLLPGEAARELSQLKDLNAIVSDLGTAPWSQTAQTPDAYLNNLFTTINQALLPEGVLSISCGPIADQSLQKQIAYLVQSHFNQVTFEQVFIPSFCEFWIFAKAYQKL